MRKKILAGILIFTMGALSGYSLSQVGFYIKTVKGHGGRKGVSPAIHKLDKKLKLSASQKESILRMLEAKKKDINEMRIALRPRYKALRNDVKSDIQTVLDENQKKQFNTMLEEAENKKPWLKEEAVSDSRDPDSGDIASPDDVKTTKLPESTQEAEKPGGVNQ